MIVSQFRRRNLKHILQGQKFESTKYRRELNRRLTKVVISKGLDDLRDEEECEIDVMLLQHTVCVLQNKWVIVVAPFEERYGGNRGDKGPQ